MVHYEYMLSVKERGFLHILVLLIILAGIIGGLYLVQHPAIFQPKARNDQTRIEFVDNSGNEITSTTSQNVKIKLTYVASSATTSVQSVSTTNGKLIAQAGSGSISASPTTCTITSGTTCSSTIAWDTVGVPDTVSVYADGNLFAQGRYGSLVAPWIGTNGNTFELRDNNGVSLGSVFVRGVTASPGSGSTAIVASPATCVFGVGGADSTRCGTTVNWSASGYSGVTVTFTRSSTHGCYSTIWNAPSGLQTVNWIDETGYYFNLCANNNSTYISQVFIKDIFLFCDSNNFKPTLFIQRNCRSLRCISSQDNLFYSFSLFSNKVQRFMNKHLPYPLPAKMFRDVKISEFREMQSFFSVVKMYL